MKYEKEFREFAQKFLKEVAHPKNKGTKYIFVDIDKTVSMFFKVLTYNVTEPTLQTIENTFENNFEAVYQNNFDKLIDALKLLGANLEPFLKKIGYLHYKDTPIWSGQGDSVGIIETTLYNLCDGVINNKHTVDKTVPLVRIPKPLIKKGAGRDLADVARNYRNELHNAKDEDPIVLLQLARIILSVYLIAVENNLQFIETLELQYFTPYLQRTLTEFQKNLLNDYTDLSAKETDLYDENLTPMAKEYYEADYEEDEKEDFDDEDFELVEETNRITKPTKVNEIRIQVPQMLVRGDAGMGKTTTLEHLFLADLQNALQNPTIIPFFFELKDYNGKDLLAQIAKQNKVDEMALRKALQEGKVCLFLDGFDEILSDEKRNNLEIIIKDEILTTPSQVLISSRVREYEHDIFKMRVFDLQALSKEQIREFASKDIAEDKKAIFLQALFEKENSVLLSICRNIFILKVYKREIIETENGEISSKTIGKLLQNLVNRRVDRQIKENKPNANTVKKDLGKYKKMINFLAYTLIDKELSFEYDLAVELLRTEFGDLRLADDCLNFYKSIGLIKGETEILKFTHKLYWEYFAAEFIWAKRQLQSDDTLRYVAVPKWKKVLNLVHGLADEESMKIVEMVAVKDALTMAESIGSSIEQKPEEITFVAIEAEKQARNFKNAEVSAQGFLALMELGETDKVLEILQAIKANKTHKIVIEKLIAQANTDKALDMIELLMSLPNSQNMLKYWAIESFNKEITNEIQKRKIEQLVDKLIQKRNNLSLNIALSWIEKYQLQDKFHIELLIEKIIETGSKNKLQLAEKWIENYQLQDKFPIKLLIEQVIKGSWRILQLAEKWIEKYKIQDTFFVEKLIKKLIEKGTYHHLQLAGKLFEKYAIQDKFPVETLIEKLIQKGSRNLLQLAESWIAKYHLQNKFPIENLIEKLIEIGKPNSLQLAENWIEKYHLQNKFPNTKVQKTHIAEQITLHIKRNDIIECHINNIVANRVFVKIKGEKRKASIYVKELAKQYIPNITQFEYNGKKLHKGQKLVAKVIRIDEKLGIQLSLKQVLNDK